MFNVTFPNPFTVNVYVQSPATEQTLTALLNLSGKVDSIMSELTDLKANVAEMKKDNARMISALADVRASNADIQAKLDEALQSTHLNAEDRAALDEIKTLVADTDAAIEAAVPEIPAPPPEVPAG